MKNILISDANHGGLTLLEEYSKYTRNNLFFYDTYNKLNLDMKEFYKKKYNVEFLSLDDIRKNEDKYITISPIHMKPLFRCDYTHHEFTGYLIKKHRECYGWNFKIIEITGVKGKTTTANLIMEVLKNKNLLVLTSHNLLYKSCEREIVLDKTLSITPASIIHALNRAKDMNLLSSIDYCIFEVSLGITTNTDIGILTNILEDYPIANNSQSASSAKKSVFKSKKVICDKTTLKKYYPHMDKNIITVSLDDKTADIYTTEIDYNIKSTSIRIKYCDYEFRVNCFALCDFYINNILYAVCVGLLLDIPIKTITSNIKDTLPIEGRGSIKYIEDKIVLEDINPGLNTTSMSKCISNLERYSNNYVLIVGGDYGITCEEIDEEKLSEYISTIDSPIFLTGDVGYNLLKKLDKDYEFYHELTDAFNYLLKKDYDVIQIIYRSEYARNITYLPN